MEKNYNRLYKIVLVGELAVGKTSFLQRYADNSFNERAHLNAFGLNFKIKIIQIANKSFKLQIWDTPGQIRYFTIMKTYLIEADGLIIIYDVTDGISFKELKNTWIKKIENLSLKKVPIFLVGNKIDIPNREITIEEEKN